MANTTNTTTRIKHVFGNVLKLAIPLTLRTVSLDNGIVVTTDTDYTPSNHYPVVVEFVNGPLKYGLDATIRDSYIAVVEDKGTIPVGTYAIVVLCRDDNGDPRRFKQRCVLDVVDVTADAGIEVGIEFETQEWLLEGAIFLAVKGEDGLDGVGIESITTDETSVSGEYNQVTFHLTNGTSYTLNVRNGESTEQTLPANVVVDENYVHTDNNYTNTDKQKVGNVDKLFGDVVYDRISRRLNFFRYGDQTHTTPLKSIDITDFVRDGRVSSFRIVDGNLTIKLNSDGGNEEFKVPISSLSNLSDYYTKSQVNSLVSGKANIDQRTGELTASQATRVVLDYIVGVYDGEDEPSHEVVDGDVWYDNGQIYHAYTGDVEVEIEPLGEPQSSIVYCNAENNKTYRWTGSSWQQVGGSSGGGSVEQVQADWAQTNTSAVDYIKNKPTIPAAQVQADWNQTNTSANDFIKNKPTIPDVSNLATKTELNNKQDTISDLSAIRSGAAAGATAAQPADIPTKVSDLTNDSGFTSNSPATNVPIMDGTANVGSSAKYAREDHVHPHDTSKLSKSDVSVETQGDGTVDINVKDDTYTINLNHTHEGMAKLEKFVESNPPASMTDDKIYVQVDDITTPTTIESLWLFGLQFAGGGSIDDGTPMMKSPTDGATIDLGENQGSGLTKTISVWAKNLNYGSSTTGLTIEAIGTGLTLSYNQQTGQSSITIPQTNGVVNTEVTLVLSGSGALANGELRFKQGSSMLASVSVTATQVIVLPEGFQDNKAWNDLTLETSQGYCISNQFTITAGHSFEICFGFMRAAQGDPKYKYGCATSSNDGFINNGRAATCYQAAVDSITRTISSVSGQYMSCTFLKSELNNCYIKDNNTNTYIWKGNNVT